MSAALGYQETPTHLKPHARRSYSITKYDEKGVTNKALVCQQTWKSKIILHKHNLWQNLFFPAKA